jgi:hypothetical protein
MTRRRFFARPRRPEGRPLRLAAIGFALAFCSLTILVRTQGTSPSDKADALAEAARKGDAAAVTKLLDAGVDVNTKFRYGATALSYACDHGHLEVVKVLIARGADVNVKDTFYGQTPLNWASGPAIKRKPEHAEIVRLLLKAGAQGKERAFLNAVGASDVAMTKVILEEGALADEALTSALELATANKKTEIIPILEAAGAKLKPELTLDESQLARYPGTYRAETGGTLTIVATGGKLVLDASKGGGPAQVQLVARSETDFSSPIQPGLRIIFGIDAGKVISVSIAGTTYKRVDQ